MNPYHTLFVSCLKVSVSKYYKVRSNPQLILAILSVSSCSPDFKLDLLINAALISQCWSVLRNDFEFTVLNT